MDDHGSLYLYSDDENIGIQLAGLYSSSLDMHINSIGAFGLSGMMDCVERVMRDEFRFGEDRCPVKF